MARNEEKNRSRNINKINNSLDIIDSKMEDIFQTTYSSRRDNKDNLDTITDSIYNTVNDILSGDESIQNIPNVTRLYTRLNNKNSIGNKDGDMINNIADALSNNNLINTISVSPDTNKYIKLMDSQYDMVCKYMPKLEKALEIKKDNVLSADNFNKEFINVVSSQLASEDKKIFDQRAIELKKKYKIDELFEKIYKDTSKYGEYFLYCVPYKKAFEELLKNKGGNLNNGIKYESCCILESGSFTRDCKSDMSNEAVEELADLKSNGKLNIEFDKSNLLSEAVYKYHKAEKVKSRLAKKKSMKEAFIESVQNSNLKISNKIFDDNLDYGKEFDNIANDGLINTEKKNSDEIKINDIPGCICKKLKHENVIPLYIEDICIGYYYFEFDFDNNGDFTRNNIINSSTFPSSVQNEDNEMRENPLLRDIARKISDEVDSQFINNNQDIKEEIYIMLKYNDKFNIANVNNIRVTFLPVDDVYHFYFNLNEETHHGISDLEKGLTSAMFWCLLDLSTTLGIVTRSQDKRIYYVKQNVDTNVARTLMNVINQVKKGNFGVRQMESMNNILNIIGRYNDHVIPMGPNGDAPIQFEVMNGQSIEIPEALLNKWEEASIDSTDVPLEFVNSSLQTDFAIKYTMSNSLFLRKVFKRQFICESSFTDIFTMIYNYEYQENESNIEIHLPAPAFLSMTNGVQLLQNSKEFIQNIADSEYSEDSEEKTEFIRLLLRHYLPTHINVPLIDKTKDLANINVLTRKQNNEDQE